MHLRPAEATRPCFRKLTCLIEMQCQAEHQLTPGALPLGRPGLQRSFLKTASRLSMSLGSLWVLSGPMCLVENTGGRRWSCSPKLLDSRALEDLFILYFAGALPLSQTPPQHHFCIFTIKWLPEHLIMPVLHEVQQLQQPGPKLGGAGLSFATEQSSRL